MKLATTLENNIIESIVDGDGFRLVMFTQGCPHHCKGCHNPETWNCNLGYEYTVEEIAKFLLLKYRGAKQYYSGITISGGDPLYQEEELRNLLSILKQEEPGLDIWIYTGYETEEVFTQFISIVDYVDVFVTGKFIEKERDISCRFRGSRNQEIVMVKNKLVEKII